MRLSDQGKYSTTPAKYSKQTCKKIQDNIRYNLRNMVITDACAGNGGDSIYFSSVFKSVQSLEKDPKEFKFLKENVEFHNIKNIKISQKSYLDVWKDLKQDIIYMDPPWGGPDYKLLPIVDLFLDGINISRIVGELFREERAKMIIIKIPHNFNIKGFSEFLHDRNLHIKKYNIYKFNLLVLYPF